MIFFTNHFWQMIFRNCHHAWTHVLVHFVKSACLYSVNPFSTFFSANNQHNCPILFCMCPTYLPAGLAFRFSFQKQLHLHFWGKWPLAPSIFWTNKLFSQIYSPKLSNEISWYHHSYVWSSLWLACWTQQTSAAAALHPVAASVSASPPLLWHKQKYDKNYFTIFCKQMSIFVNISSNFLHAIFRPQATIWTKNPLNPAKIGAKTTPLFYKIRNKIMKSRSMNWSIKRWIVGNGLAVILTPKSTS